MGRDHVGEDAGQHGLPQRTDTPMLRTGFAVRELDPNTAMADVDDLVPLGCVAGLKDIADVLLCWRPIPRVTCGSRGERLKTVACFLSHICDGVKVPPRLISV